MACALKRSCFSLAPVTSIPHSGHARGNAWALPRAAHGGAEEDLLESTRSHLRELGLPLEKDFPRGEENASSPRMYYREMRSTEVGNAFWRQSTTEKWGEFASGDAGKFDKDDLVEALYPDSNNEWYCAQVMRYIGNSNWIVFWVDDMEEGMAQASVIKTKDMNHIKLR